ncbi:hypothetical protein B0T19DRAFT_432882 [Cercophora scortea]|uniref:Uncharacterized protein n=1 Tax=Cercophora scortea TaxID=314031 RepID=A0AAE0I6S6_9PEZI|nr:hypothetical protein B0T19DRAFT_432882 [Cercophora scortea]
MKAACTWAVWPVGVGGVVGIASVVDSTAWLVLGNEVRGGWVAGSPRVCGGWVAGSPRSVLCSCSCGPLPLARSVLGSRVCGPWAWVWA